MFNVVNIIKGAVKPFKKQLKEEAMKVATGAIIDVAINYFSILLEKAGEKIKTEIMDICEVHNISMDRVPVFAR